MDLQKESQLPSEPFELFTTWFEEALKHIRPEPTVVALATASRENVPSARMVLLKKIDGQRFFFFTNYESRKGQDLMENPRASLLFYWGELSRQVRVEGLVEKTERQASEKYFYTRPFKSQIGAWASQQSREVESRAVLEKRFNELLQKYQGKTVPLPPFWGGFSLVPSRIEFWQNQEDRLHDRILYFTTKTGWQKKRLFP